MKQRINLHDLIAGIAYAQTDKNPDGWKKPDLQEWEKKALEERGEPAHDNDVARDLAAAMIQGGFDSIPGLLPHLKRAIESGAIIIRSTFSDIPALGADDVIPPSGVWRSVNDGSGLPDYEISTLTQWYVTPDDADKLCSILGLPLKGAEYAGQTGGQIGDAISNGASGTVTVWTPERVAKARAMRDRLKKEGKPYAKLTADYYGVSTTRLREVLKRADSTTKKVEQKKAGPWDALGT